MKRIWLSFQQIKRAVAIASVLSVCIINPINAQPLPNRGADNVSSLRQIHFNSPDLTGRGRPGDRKSAASRGQCHLGNSSESLYALIPDTNLGLTVDGHPTFWFYFPDQVSKFHSMKFALWSEKGQKIYETTYQAATIQPGVVSIPVPETAPVLEQNQNYNWILTAYCEDPQQASDPTDPQKVRVRGSIQRITPTPELEQELKAAVTPREQAYLYAQKGVWFNALTILGNLRRTETGNGTLDTDWTNLLSDIGLNEISQKPIVECCRASSN
ncbi:MULTISPECIES: DUF928 domain-containing protein [unclassified Coleofasciculus]|uniref:DUF928 domain-containing protein n=1 Tax=unclassified Coleofasciculus TaxID=2692782 RepID=UPI001882DB2F|nr:MULTISPECIES: DUF928 domain-containing protein [unclassified Coleofasciculus]MBE9124889.1 DUF928 domain-containing protein [Coleofasciculus sp. LEGE 07081]MBE9147867.1 DUF928 domain-containing protein [Coleofasciculus sp. LEGE 07092]